MNMLLVSGVMFAWLYFTGIWEPAPPEVVVASFVPTPSPSLPQSPPTAISVNIDLPSAVVGEGISIQSPNTTDTVTTNSMGRPTVNVSSSIPPPAAVVIGRPRENNNATTVVDGDTGSTTVSNTTTPGTLDDPTKDALIQHTVHRYIIPTAISTVAVLLEVALVMTLCAYHRRWKAQQALVAEENTFPVDDSC